MRPLVVARAAGTGASVPVECCQICGHAPLDEALSLGYMPPVNQMVPVGEMPRQQAWFPTNLLHCRNCDLVQLGLAVDPAIIFPPDYPYTSGTTKLLGDNFADLRRESADLLGLGNDDLVVDIGSNDGTLLSNFQNGGHRVLGIEPTDVGDIALKRGIPTIKRYFSPAVAREVKREYGPASVVTAANCFAHIEDVHAIVDGIVDMLAPGGAFISNPITSSAFSTPFNTTPSITNICAITPWRVSSICSRCMISKYSMHARFRVMAVRSVFTRRGAVHMRYGTTSRACSPLSRVVAPWFNAWLRFGRTSCFRNSAFSQCSAISRRAAPGSLVSARRQERAL